MQYMYLLPIESNIEGFLHLVETMAHEQEVSLRFHSNTITKSSCNSCCHFHLFAHKITFSKHSKEEYC